MPNSNRGAVLGRWVARTLSTILLLSATLALFADVQAEAPDIKVLYTFGTLDNSGSNFTTLGEIFNGPGLPVSIGGDGNPVIMGGDGNLYGTNLNAGYGQGKLYRVSTNGSLLTIHYFGKLPGDGTQPSGRLVQDSNGVLYGVTISGGAGSVGSGAAATGGVLYRINADGSGYQVLHAFGTSSNDGYAPGAGLILAKDGRLYGSTFYGGTGQCAGPDNQAYGDQYGCGVVFVINTDGSGYQVLRSFTGLNGDGNQPVGELLQGSDGYLYGVTGYGGVNSGGTIYRIATDGSQYDVLYPFGSFGGDGVQPGSGLSLGTNGNLYGTTTYGGVSGYGVVYEVLLGQGEYQVVHTFSGPGPGTNTDGALPVGELVQGADGNLYGTTGLGGQITFNGITQPKGYGTVFSISPSNGYRLVYSFNGFMTPQGPLARDSKGTLYAATMTGGQLEAGGLIGITPTGSGTVIKAFGNPIDSSYPSTTLAHAGNLLFGVGGGGNSSCGSIFSISLAGNYTQIYSFGSKSQIEACVSHRGQLLGGADGNIYGTTSDGPVSFCDTNGCGTLYQLTPQGTYTTLHTFVQNGVDGNAPLAGPIQANDGGLYGTTSGGGAHSLGTVYKVASNGSGYRILYSFGATPTDGTGPAAELVQGSDGYLYGTTAAGGTPQSNIFCTATAAACGTVFRIATDGSGYTVLHSFTGSDGSQFVGSSPSVALIQGANGRLFGVASGQPFGLNTDGSNFQALQQPFPGYSDGGDFFPGGPQGALIQGRDGYLYGTVAYGGPNPCFSQTGFHAPCGYLFRIAPDFSGYADIHDFTGSDDGAAPFASLIQLADGTFYGVTSFDGGIPYAKAGTVFSFAGAPAVPQNVSVASGSDSATIKWNVAAGAASYNVYSGVSAGEETPSPVVSGVVGTSVTIRNLSGGASYFFKVTAVNSAGESLPSAESAVTPSGPPAAPTSLTASVGHGQVQLNWIGTPGATAYGVYEGTSTGGEAASAVQMVSGSTGALITGLGNGVHYYFVVKASGPTGISPASNEVSATPQATAPTITISITPETISQDGSAQLTWTSTQAAACTATGAWSGTQPLAGSLGLAPTVTGVLTYGLSCTGSGGTTTQAASLTVVPTASGSSSGSSGTASSSSSSGASSGATSGGSSGGGASSGGGGAVPPLVLLGLTALALLRRRRNVSRTFK